MVSNLNKFLVAHPLLYSPMQGDGFDFTATASSLSDVVEH